MKARTVSTVIAGEATSGTPEQRYQDMLHIASVIKNRADMLGVTPEQIIAAQNQSGYEFSAYNKALPPGVDDNITGLAAKAWEEVNTSGPVTNATFYATPSAKSNLPNGLEEATTTDGHVFFTDPKFRSIATTEGYQKPNPGLLQTAYDNTTETLGGLFSTGKELAGQAGGMGMGLLDRGMDEASNVAAPVTAMFNPGAASLEGRPKSYNGLAGYDPSQDLGLGPAKLPTVNFDQYNSGRPNMPSQQNIELMQQAVDAVVGPGATIALTSGADDAHQTGTIRHGLDQAGYAADYEITLPNGHTLNIANPQDKQMMVDVSQAAAAINGPDTSIGLYAGKPNMVHLDNIPSSRMSPGMARQWEAAKPFAGLLDDARTNGTMPTSYWDRVASNVEQKGITPSLLDRNQMQIAQPDQMMAAINPPMDNTVTRSALPASTVNGWQDMATANQANPAVAAIETQTQPDLAQRAAANPSLPDQVITAGVEEYGPQQITSGELDNFAKATFGAQTLGVPARGMLQNAIASTANPGLLASSVPMSLPSVPTPTGQIVAGPATSEIPAAQPQTVSKPAVSQPAAPAKKEGLLSKAMTSLDLSKEQLAGGLLGGMTLGPIGGLLGALAGRYVANNPGALGSFQNQPMVINNLGSGPQAMQGVYGPSAVRGNTFTANNGATVTARGDGSVNYTSNKYGYTEVHGPNGTISAVW